MKNVRDVVDREIIEDLWGAGYTILPRRRHADPFHVPPEIVPQGRSYQWWHLVHDKFHFERPQGAMPSGWAPVPASRHDGYFMPAGHVGDIEVNGLGLFEKSKFEVDQERAEQVAAAHKHVDDWVDKTGSLFSGTVTVGNEIGLGKGSLYDVTRSIEIGDTKTVEDVTAIPRDMVPYIAQIFEERDRLSNAFVYDEAREEIKGAEKLYMAHIKEHPDAPKWPTLNAILLPQAIENVRKRITEEAASGQAS